MVGDAVGFLLGILLGFAVVGVEVLRTEGSRLGFTVGYRDGSLVG